MSIIEILKKHTVQTMNTFIWLSSKMNHGKMVKRVIRAYIHPNETVKMVLVEYAYTSRSYVEQGNPNIVEYMPDSNVLVHHAINTPDFIRFMDEYFGTEKDKVSVYVRQRINSDGTPDFHRKQLVLKYEPYALIPRPVS